MPNRNDEQVKELLAQAAAAMLLYERPIVFNLDITATIDLIGLVQLALRHPDAAKLPAAERTRKFMLALIENLDRKRGPIYEVLMMGFDPQWDMVQERLAGVGEVDRRIVERILEEVDRVAQGEGSHELSRLFLSTSRRERLAQIVYERRTK